MFFNDPILYGTTLPYKDPQAPFMGQFAPWQQNYQKFIPQQFGYNNYGYQHFVPPYELQHFNQFVPPYALQQPYNLQHFNQFVPYNLPFQAQLPFQTQPWNMQIPQHFQMNLPQHGWQRPFVY
jgi:hypothetical protein